MAVFQNLLSAILVKKIMFFLTLKKKEDDRKRNFIICKGNSNLKKTLQQTVNMSDILIEKGK